MIKDKIYIEKLRRREIFTSFRNRIMRRHLMRVSKKHLENGEPQIAIFSFDIIGITVMLDGQYEKDELAILGGWLTEKFGCRLRESVAIDCGANIGNHSVYFSKIFRRVVSFEPNPRTFRLLEFNCHELNNVECFNFGLSDVDECIDLNVPRSNIGGASKFEVGNSRESVETSRADLKVLDNLEIKLDNLLLIKVDVEGQELNALRGAQNTISKFLPIIAFEQAAREFENGSSGVIDWLKMHGYTKFYCLEKRPGIKSGFWRKSLVFLRRILFGQYIQMRLVDGFEKKYYPLIVAEAPPLREALKEQ